MIVRTKNRFVPPWESGEVAVVGIVRERFASGFWDYALGRDPVEHPDYEKAVGMAEDQGWNAWWIRRYGDVQAVLDGCYFDIAAAEYICDFFESFLTLSKGKWAGKAFELIDWERYDFLMPLNGWKNLDGWRRFSEAALWISKKNGKSALISGLSLFFLVADDEDGPEVYCVAGERAQAARISDEAETMVKAHPGLNSRLTCVQSKKTIAYPGKNGKMVALSADADLKEGYNWNFVGFDELHVQKTPKMFDILYHGGESRDQSLLVTISTAGVFSQVSIGWTQWETAGRVLSGSINDSSFFALVYAADPEGDKDSIDDWKSEETWWKANPSLNVTIALGKLRSKCEKAIASPRLQNAFKRYRVNLWVRQATRWMAQDKWSACAAEFGLDDLAGRSCYAGVDLASSNDTTALALWFPARDASEKPRTFLWFWLPEDNLQELEDHHGVPYVQWAEEGWLETTPGNIIDDDFIRKRINTVAEIVKIEGIAFDPHNAGGIISNLIGDGFDLAKHHQGFGAMSSPVKELEKLVLGERMEHRNDPVMNWQMSNCQAVVNADNDVKIMKSDAQGTIKFKVDGPVAMIMALSMSSQNPVVERESMYKGGGVGVVVSEY